MTAFIPEAEHFVTWRLWYDGTNSLLGVTPDGEIYVEEVYGEDFFAQHRFSAGGDLLQSVDERHGEAQVSPLPLPEDILEPVKPPADHWLNFAGARLRGMREEERVRDMLLPIPLPDKMKLVQQLGLNIPAMLLLGLAESRVLALADLTPTIKLVCRRVRLAYALPETQQDAAGQPYDYDTITLHRLHPLTPDDDITLHLLPPADAAAPRNPTGCMVVGDRLYVADSGLGMAKSALHLYRRLP